MDDAVDNFVAFTGATSEVARRYLALTENNAEQAIQLFFDSPDLATAATETPAPPPVPSSTRPQTTSSTAGRQDAGGVINLDSDDDEMDVDNDNDDDDLAQAAALSRAADMEDDEAMARRMQEELYAGGGGGGNDLDEEGVRAPIARRTETLVGGHDEGAWSERDYMQAAVAQQMRNRAQGGMSSKCWIRV